MKILRVIGTSGLVVIFFMIGFSFAQKADKQTLVKDVESVVKWKFEDTKQQFGGSLEEVAIETIRYFNEIHPFRDSINPADATVTLAELDDPQDDFEKNLNDLKKQFEGFAKELNRIPESDEFKRFLKELERLQDELKKGGESAKEKLEKEIIPMLKEEMEKLKEKFLKPRRRESEEPIEV